MAVSQPKLNVGAGATSQVAGRRPRTLCVVTSGHLASTPRMLKAADAFHEAGYKVRVVCAEHVEWSIAASRQTRTTREWACRVVDWHRGTGRGLYYRSALRQRLARLVTHSVGRSRASLGVLARAVCRVAPELVAAAAAEPADLVYGGTSGGLAVTALVARRLGVPYALDLEDFHSAEQPDGPEARRAHAVMEEVERRVLSGAGFLTAGSEPISAAYAAKYSVRPVTINNVFSLPTRIPDFVVRPGQPLRLYWFSQRIGPGRGLEDAIRACGLLDRPLWLGILGNKDENYAKALKSLTNAVAPKLQLQLLPNRPPDEMVEACRGMDVGLALETGCPLNRELCLSNKIFTYILAGLAVVVTDTQGQRAVAEDLGEGAILYRPGDVAALAHGLRRWADDPEALLRAKRACWEAARRRWHWEHPRERGALLECVARVWQEDRVCAFS
jgi:glycosyltransferase involved in cell wall biosynthesis